MPQATETLTHYTRNTIVTPARLEEELEAVRETGVALDQEEAMRDICCTAAPIFDTDGKLLGAVGLTTTSSRFIRRRDPYLRTVRGAQRGDLPAGPQGSVASAPPQHAGGVAVEIRHSRP